MGNWKAHALAVSLPKVMFQISSYGYYMC